MTRREVTDAERSRALAVALKYAPGDAAPVVIAKGRGVVAAEIIARAKEHGIFVHESPELVTLLSRVDAEQAATARADLFSFITLWTFR